MPVYVLAQTDTAITSSKKDTAEKNKPAERKKPVVKPKKDSIVINTIAQVDSTKINDSILVAQKNSDSLKQDSLNKAISVANSTKKNIDTSTYATLLHHSNFPFGSEKIYFVSQEKKTETKDLLFYSLLGIVAILAFIVVAFPKYFQDVFTIFLQTSFRQKQTREQLFQNNLASLLMNLLFVISGGMLITLAVSKFNLVQISFWWLLLYSTSFLAIVYLVKYLFLNFSGWVFNIGTSTESYSFIVFLMNKILGVLFVPVLLIVAFSFNNIVNVTLIVTACIIALLFLYRYVVSLGTIRTDLKVNALHFFLYLCAVEILPILIMYKALFNFING